MSARSPESPATPRRGCRPPTRLPSQAERHGPSRPAVVSGGGRARRSHHPAGLRGRRSSFFQSWKLKRGHQARPAFPRRTRPWSTTQTNPVSANEWSKKSGAGSDPCSRVRGPQSHRNPAHLTKPRGGSLWSQPGLGVSVWSMLGHLLVTGGGGPRLAGISSPPRRQWAGTGALRDLLNSGDNQNPP